MQEVAVKIGKAIRQKRKALGMTTSQLGDLVGLKRASISNIELAKQSIYAHKLWEIAKILKCKSVSELFPPLSTKISLLNNDIDDSYRSVGEGWMQKSFDK